MRVDILVVGVLLDTEQESLVQELRSIQPEMRVIRIGGEEESDDSTTLSTPLSLDDSAQPSGGG